MLNKKGDMTTHEILEIVLAVAVVFVLAVLFFRLIYPTMDVNKEYAEGVYEKLEQAASEVESVGRGEFSILDVPVDYGDSVFLVLFSGRDYVSLSEYPVEIKNSGFMTYFEKSAGPVLSEGGMAYYSLLRGAGVSDDVAREASEKIVGEVAIKAVENVDDILFKIDMRQIVRNFATTTGVSNPDRIIQEILDDGVGVGLSPEKKMNALKVALGKYIPEGSKVGRFNNIDTFMSSATALAKTHNLPILQNEIAFNLDAERVIRDFVTDEDSVQAMVKEMTDDTFGEGLGLVAKKGRLKDLIVRNVDNSLGIDDALNGIKEGRTAKDALKVALGTVDDVSDDVVKAAANKILSVKSIPTEEITKGVVEETLTNKGVSKSIVSGMWKMVPRGRVVSLTFKAVGKIAGAAFIAWELYEYYTVTHDAKAWVLTALNQEGISENSWVANKFLQSVEGNNALCVCYINDDYTRNYCFGCVGFDKPVVTEPSGKNYWTFCNDMVLEDKGNSILLTGSVREGCKSSIAFTNSECEESRGALKVELNTVGNKMAEAAASVGAGITYGTAMGVIGGCLGGGIVGFFGGAGIGAIPGCVAGAVGGAKLGAVGGAAIGSVVAYQDVEFSCDGHGHIYLGETFE